MNFPEEASFLLERTESVCGWSKQLLGGCLSRKEDVLIYSRCETAREACQVFVLASLHHQAVLPVGTLLLKAGLLITIIRRRGDSQQQGLAYPGAGLVEGLRLD